MKFCWLIAMAAVGAAPAVHAKSPARPPAEAKAEGKKPAIDPLQTMAAMLTIFDKFFPAGPEPDPARLAIARGTATMMFPSGAYSQAMTKFVDKTMDRVLDMSEADLAAVFPEAKKDKKAKAPSTEPLRVKLARDEPNFEAKLAAVRAFAGTMLTKLGAAAEPKFREGMARAMARKFDAAQLAEINAFLATPTGAAYGRQTVGMWFEPDVMRGTFELFPEMIKMMPELAEDAAAMDAELRPKGGKK